MRRISLGAGKVVTWLTLAAASIVSLGTLAYGQQPENTNHPDNVERAGAVTAVPSALQRMKASTLGWTIDGIHVLKAQDPMAGTSGDWSHVWLLSGDGSNIAAEVFHDGVLLVNSGLASESKQVLAALRTIAPDPTIHYIIDTSDDPDVIGGNAALGKTGNQFVGGNILFDNPAGGTYRSGHEGAQIFAYETAMLRIAHVIPGDPRYSPDMYPQSTYMTHFRDLSPEYHGDAVEMIHEPSAHTDGDTIVWFRYSNVIATGEIFDPTHYPVIELNKGGSIDGEIAALDDILAIAFPYFRLEDGTMIIPGHGGVGDSEDVEEYRNMVQIVRDRVQYMIKHGKNLEEVEAANLTTNYDPIYATKNYTGKQFVAGVYKSLKAPPARRGVAGLIEGSK